MAKGPPFSGFGGYGPWPDNDPEPQNPSPHYEDGYHNRAPGGHMEAPTDIWIDRMLYPVRLNPVSVAEADGFDARSRDFRLTVGNITGRKPGPEE